MFIENIYLFHKYFDTRIRSREKLIIFKQIVIQKKKEENNVMMLFIYTHQFNSNFKIWQQYQISSFNGLEFVEDLV